MTLGQKIKVLRTTMGLTQAQLAKAAELHPVTIRKYEIDKMQPQMAQIEKLAKVLQVSRNVFLLDSFSSVFSMRTIGDFLSLIIQFYNKDLISIMGDRGDDKALRLETVRIKLSPKGKFSDLISIQHDSEANAVSLNDLTIKINKKQIVVGLIELEKEHYLLKELLENTDNADPLSREKQVANMKAHIELVELNLQQNTIPLDFNGLAVKTISPWLSKLIVEEYLRGNR